MNFMDLPNPIESNELVNVEISNLTYNVEPDCGLTNTSNFEKTTKNTEFKRSKVVFEDKGYTYGQRIQPNVNISIPDDMNAFTDALWNSLNEENKVSLFVRYIDIATGEYETKIINKNQ